MTAFAGLVRLLSRLLFWVSVVATIIVVLGLFGLLSDEVRGSSTEVTFLEVGQDATGQPVKVDITEPDPSATVEAAREKEHSSAREAWDDAGDYVLRPFTLNEDSPGWEQRLLASGLALVVYLLLLQLLADGLKRMAEREIRDQRAKVEAKEDRQRRDSGTYRSPS